MTDSVSLRTQRWTYGRRYVSTRPLSHEESAALANERQAAKRFVVGATIGYVVGLLLAGRLAVALASVDSSDSATATSVAVVLLLLVLVATAIVLLGTRDRLRTSRSAARDLAAGTVEIFEPVPGGAAAAEPERTVPLAIATSSHRVLAGPAELRGHEVDIAEVAEGAQSAYRVHVQSFEDGSVLEQRHLTESEREELRQTIARMRRPGRAVWAALLILMAAGYVWGVAGPDRSRPLLADYVRIVAACALSGTMLWQWGRDVHRSFQMQRDLEQGVVLWASHPEGGPEPFEFLPNSGVIWWLGRVPPAWRSLSRRAAGR